MKTAEETFKKAMTDLGFADYKPSEMSNSDYWNCSILAMKTYANAKLDEAIKQAIVFNSTPKQILVELKDEL